MSFSTPVVLQALTSSAALPYVSLMTGVYQILESCQWSPFLFLKQPIFIPKASNIAACTQPLKYALEIVAFF